MAGSASFGSVFLIPSHEPCHGLELAALSLPGRTNALRSIKQETLQGDTVPAWLIFLAQPTVENRVEADRLLQCSSLMFPLSPLSMALRF